MTGLQIRLALRAENHVLLRGDEFQLVRVRIAHAAEDGGGALGEHPVIRLAARERADGGGGNVAGENALLLQLAEELRSPIAARGQRLGGSAAGGGAEVFPLDEERLGGRLPAELAQAGDGFEHERLGVAGCDGLHQRFTRGIVLELTRGLRGLQSFVERSLRVVHEGQAGLHRTGVAPERAELAGEARDVFARAGEERLQHGLGGLGGLKGLALLAVREAAEGGGEERVGRGQAAEEVECAVELSGVLQVADAAHGFVSQRAGERCGADFVQQGEGELRVARHERLGGHPDEVVQQEVRGRGRGGDERGENLGDGRRVRLALRLGVHRERTRSELAAGGRDGDAHGGFAIAGELAEEREVLRVAELLLADEPRGPGADGGLFVRSGLGKLVVCEIAGAVERPERGEAGFKFAAAG